MEEEINVTLDDLISEVNSKSKNYDKKEIKDLAILQTRIKEYYLSCDDNKKQAFVKQMHNAIVMHDKKIRNHNKFDQEKISDFNDYLNQMLIGLDFKEGDLNNLEDIEQKQTPQYFLDVKKQELDNTPLYMDYLKSKIKECIDPYIELRKLDKIAVISGVCLITLLMFSLFINNIFIMLGTIFFAVSLISIAHKNVEYRKKMMALSSQEKSYPLGEILYAYGIPFEKITQYDFTFQYCIKKDTRKISKAIKDKMKTK